MYLHTSYGIIVASRLAKAAALDDLKRSNQVTNVLCDDSSDLGIHVHTRHDPDTAKSFVVSSVKCFESGSRHMVKGRKLFGMLLDTGTVNGLIGLNTGKHMDAHVQKQDPSRR